ncbi:MAG: DsbA family protein [Mycobacteriaceae bacterium]|uniref:DsbA family protein n=1 Tax=Corynebacterium sp. TaxID=1720 RepID=UPI003F9C49B7
MSQKIKAPNDKNRSFIWGIVALVAICAVVIAFMVINGRKGGDVDLASADVDFDVALEDGVVTMRGQDAAEDAPAVDIFEDYSCTHCADLAEVDSDSLQKAVGDGEMNVDLHTVKFVDEETSTRTGAVALAIADTGDAGAFWGFHKKAFEDQATVSRDWEFEELADAADQVGVDSGVVDSIRDESVLEEYSPMLDANGEELGQRMGDQAATPAIFVGGEQFPLQQDPENPGAMKDWVPDVLALSAGETPEGTLPEDGQTDEDLQSPADPEGE